jgi:hypothetical protein
MAGTDEALDAAVEAVRTAYHRLVLLVGPPGTGKSGRLRSYATRHTRPYVNVNLGLSQRMLELTKTQRARQADPLFNQIVADADADVVVLDNCEILFDRSLQLDPLRLLQLASRNRTVVASWSGTMHGGTLTYAEPQHPEHRAYGSIDAVVLPATGTVAKTS